MAQEFLRGWPPGGGLLRSYGINQEASMSDNNQDEILKRLERIEERENQEYHLIKGALRPIWETYRDLKQITGISMADLIREDLKSGLETLGRLNPVFEEINRCRLFVRRFGEDKWDARWFTYNPFRLIGQHDELHELGFRVNKKDLDSCNNIGTTLGLENRGKNILTQTCLMFQLDRNPQVSDADQDYFHGKIGTVLEMIVARCVDAKYRESRALSGAQPVVRLHKGQLKDEIDFTTIFRLTGIEIDD